MKFTLLRLFLTATIITMFSGYLSAAPPTDEVIQRLKDEGRFDEFMKSMNDARARGVNSPVSSGISAEKGAMTPDTPFRVLVLLIDFGSMPYTSGYAAGTIDDFDSLLFSEGLNPTGSMKEYYLENSYGNFVMEGDVFGWYRAAESHQYYTNFCDGSRGTGAYPNNAQRLVEEAIDAADPYVDFSQYDNDGNGYVDGIFVVHSGSGYEESGDYCQIHSHKWSISPRLRDGVYISTYSIEPEESASSQGLIPIGVFCHEFGHVLGLPDLYDTDYSSSGAGRWALMASGSYNGQSRTPSQFIAWSKMKLGWLDPVNVTANQIDAEIPAVEWNPVAYRLWKHGTVGPQYFIVENRQKVGFDEFIPGSGLLIWHIDDNVNGNTNDWHPQVFLEQADGRFDLQNGGSGNPEDAFPGSGVTNFDDKTTPGSRDYNSQSTEVAVWDISPSDSVMTANLDVFWSRPYLYLTTYEFDDAAGGNGNGILEQGETIELTLTVANDWKAVSTSDVTMTVDDADVSVSNGVVSLGSIGSGSSASNVGNPLTFSIPVDYEARIDSFFLEITTDGGEYTTVLGIEQNVGAPSIVLIDNDNGMDYEQYYSATMYTSRLPYDIWDVSQSGTPGAGDLGAYSLVIWFVGDYRAGPLDASAVPALQGFLDGGGNLFLSGQGIAEQLSSENPAFLSDYLKSTYTSSDFMPVITVHPSSPTFAGITDSISLHGVMGGASNTTNPDRLAAVNGGVPELEYAVSTDLAAVSYAGAYRLMFFGFPMESIYAGSSRYVERDTIYNRVLSFLNVNLDQGLPTVVATAVGPGDPEHLIDHSPQISWTYYDADGAPQDSFQVQVGTDGDWTAAEAWDYGPVAGADSQVVYSGQTLIDGATYFVRIRVFNGDKWSTWRSDSFRMNSAPVAPSGMVPDNLSGVVSTNPNLEHQNASDAENDELTYGYEVYADSFLANLVVQTDGQLQGSGTSEWTVSSPLDEDSIYYWRARAFDGFEYGLWSEAASFWVNADNQFPVSFSLIAPQDSAMLIVLQPEFIWSSSDDLDRFDGVKYSLVWSTEADFSVADTAAGLTDTVFTLDDSLSYGNIYYWKTLAYDQFGGITESDRIFTATTRTLGDASGDGDVNVGDAVFLINFIFKGGAAPEPLAVGDMNQDCDVNVADAVYLINYVFKDGPPPLPGCE